MNNYQDVIRNILLLLDTIQDGLTHMKYQIESLDFESAHDMLNDVFIAVLSIKEALIPFTGDSVSLKTNIFMKSEDILIRRLKETTICFTEGQHSDYSNLITKLNDSFEDWKTILLSAFTPRGYH